SGRARAGGRGPAGRGADPARLVELAEALDGSCPRFPTRQGCATIPASLVMAGAYPRRFGKYVLLKPMARGGMVEIYLAATGETGFEKCCVIKKIIAEKSDRAKSQRFLDEAKVVLRLSHANLVPTFDAGEIDGEFFIAMDLVEGK